MFGRRHRAEGSERVVSLLKSPHYGAPGDRAHLPYRIDLLASNGYELQWLDDDRSARLDPVIKRIERACVPFAQAWRTRRMRQTAAITLAMFESEAHGLAVWRRLTGRRRPPLVVVECWLAELAAESGVRRRLYRQLYRSVDHVIAFSTNQISLLTDILDIPRERITAVRFGVDLDELDDIEVSDDGRTVVAIGRDLGRDWRTLATAVRGTGWNIELVTRRHQVEHITLPPEIHHRPPVDRATYLDLLSQSAVVVVPTDIRAYPTGQTVLLEAMALGKACVVTDTPAMREYVDDGVTALTVPPHDDRALRQAIERLLDDQPLRATLGARAQEVESKHGGARAMWASVAAVLARTVDEGVPSDGQAYERSVGTMPDSSSASR